jgi:HK97 family phage major capsid protein
MPFDSIVSRSDAASTIPEEVAADVIKAATEQSATLSLFRRVNMGSALSTLPVLSALAQAYWVAGDTGLKQTTEMAWAGVNLVAEELAAIVPVPENVVADSAIDIWSEVREGLAEAVGVALDQAVLMGTNKPSSWPAAIVPAAIAAGNTAEQGTATTAQGGIVGDIDTALDEVEDDGFDANAIAAKRSLRGLLRRARDTQGPAQGALCCSSCRQPEAATWSARVGRSGSDTRARR